jgi:uncharacterized protein (TIGR04255 family)
MKIDILPTRLTAEPLIEAVCEMRFVSDYPAASILPGLLLRDLGETLGPVSVNPLPASAIPKDVRAADPALREAPLISLRLGDFTIFIGDSLLAVSAGHRYPGWASFHPVIQRAFRSAANSNVINSVTRYSLKYVDLLPKASGRPAGGMDIDIRIGQVALTNHNASVRLEVMDDPFIHVIQAITNATAKRDGEEPRSGPLIEVDTVCIAPPSGVAEFFDSLGPSLDDAHDRNKRIFFECLSTETFERLGPIYE